MTLVGGIVIGVAAILLGYARYGIYAIVLGALISTATVDVHPMTKKARTVAMLGGAAAMLLLIAGYWWIAVIIGVISGFVAFIDQYEANSINNVLAEIFVAVGTFLVFGQISDVLDNWKLILALIGAVIAGGVIVVTLLHGATSGEAPCVVIIAVVALIPVFYYATDYLNRQSRESNLERYGERAFEVCVFPPRGDESTARLPGQRVVFVEAGPGNRGKVLSSYVLPDEMVAEDEDDLDAVVCIEEVETTVASQGYRRTAPGAGPTPTCNRIRRDIVAYVVDVEADELLAKRVFEGDSPPTCPATTRNTGVFYKTGDAPDEYLVARWVRGLLSEPPDS